jgi:protein associated with RNAse G/E
MALKLVRVETFSYPDVPRYFFPAAIVDEQPDYFIIYHPAGAPLWSGKDGKLHRGTHHSMGVLYPDRDYNLILFWTADWTFDAYYVNIALPTRWDGEVVDYIDLDLDVLWLTEQTPRVQNGLKQAGVYILDRDEYEERKIAYNYPPELMERAEAALHEVIAQIEARAFPFDDALVGWRPSEEMLALADLPDSASLWHLEGSSQWIND